MIVVYIARFCHQFSCGISSIGVFPDTEIYCVLQCISECGKTLDCGYTCISVCSVCVCMCVCVCECACAHVKERERERERVHICSIINSDKQSSLYFCVF